jgi:hypothetical protein
MLDSNGEFLRNNVRVAQQPQGRIEKGFTKNKGQHTTELKFWWKSKDKPSAADHLRAEIQHLQLAFHEEKIRFEIEYRTEKAKNKRLLYLFQKDLLPGVSGQVLESKDRRDDAFIRTVPLPSKILAWSFLVLLNLGMLFYILLFAVSQEVHRQRAWAISFGTWLALEVFVISTVMVFFMHVLLPLLIMDDVNKIKRQLLVSLKEYQLKLLSSTTKQKKLQINESHHNNCSESDSDQSEIEHEQINKDPRDFNAARYLFLSNKMSVEYPDLRMAKIIAGFRTIWPKQSLHRVNDLSQIYTRKFQSIVGAVRTIVASIAATFVTIPPGLQDCIGNVLTTAGAGYVVILHGQMFKIYPMLVVVPILFVISIGYVASQFFQGSKKVEQARLAQMVAASPEEINNTNSPPVGLVEEGKGDDITDELNNTIDLDWNRFDFLKNMAFSSDEDSEDNSTQQLPMRGGLDEEIHVLYD